jgi:peroxiredoxin
MGPLGYLVKYIYTLASAQGKAFRLIGLSLRAEGVADYISKNNITFPVYVEPQAEFIKDLKLGATPETLVVGRNGKIEKVWMGAYASAAQQEVEKVFGVSLPGMVMPSAASNMASSPSEE